MKLTGAEIVIEMLVKHGADTVFGYPGGAVLDIYDELYKNSSRIEHILAAHEQGAAHAADGYARASGKTGVVIATSGPGATNLVTGIANAYLDSVPLVAITGNVAVALLGRDSFQEVDIVGITQPIVKHNYLVKDISKLERTIDEAFALASTGRKGPVLIDIPKSVQAETCEYVGASPAASEAGRQHQTGPLSDAVLTEALATLRQAERPYIYCGGGVIASGAEREIMELSRKLSAPIGLSMMGLTAVPHSYELNLGMCGMHGTYASSLAQSEADVVIAAGVRFSDRATGDVSTYRRNCTVIHIDIDAAEIGKNVATDIALHGDVKSVLAQLLPRMSQHHNEGWVQRIAELKAANPRYADPLHTNTSPAATNTPAPFSPRNIIETVRSHCQDDTVVATDVGQHQMWTMQFYPFEKPRTLLTSGGLGTMGYGLGAAIGGCLANGRTRTVLFTSDGSFGMNLNELATAVSHELPIVIVVLNNSVLGMVRQWQGMFYGERYSQTTLDRKTDFPALARAFGAQGSTATTLEELLSILAALTDDGPHVIDCKIDPNEKVFPMIPPGGSVDDIMISETCLVSRN